MCEAFRNYFSSTFRKDEGNDPKLNYSAISYIQHFTISAKDVHQQLINLNPRKSEGADEIHPRILTSLARYLAVLFENRADDCLAPILGDLSTLEGFVI